MKYLVAYRAMTARGTEVQGRTFLDLPEDLSIADVLSAEREIEHLHEEQLHYIAGLTITNLVPLRGEQ